MYICKKKKKKKTEKTEKNKQTNKKLPVAVLLL